MFWFHVISGSKPVLISHNNWYRSYRWGSIDQTAKSMLMWMCTVSRSYFKALLSSGGPLTDNQSLFTQTCAKTLSNFLVKGLIYNTAYKHRTTLYVPCLIDPDVLSYRAFVIFSKVLSYTARVQRTAGFNNKWQGELLSIIDTSYPLPAGEMQGWALHISVLV